MDFYHTWLYTHIINTRWFLWTLVYAILVGNVLSPIAVWLLMSGKTRQLGRWIKKK